jgi:hypothetical protein
MSKKLKYAIIALVCLIFLLVAFVVYRMYFLFNRTKVKDYATAIANSYGASPDKVYQLLIESCEYIKKSSDLVAQVKLSAEIEGIDREEALVNAALNQCISLGYLEAAPEAITPIES